MSQNLGVEWLKGRASRKPVRKDAKAPRRARRRGSSLQDRKRGRARPQSIAAVRAGRPRAHRVHRARRRQGGPVLGGSRDHGGDQHPLRPHAALVCRSDRVGGGAGLARALLRRPLEQRRAPHVRPGRDPGGGARARRQPLQGSGVVAEPLFRFLEAVLPHHLTLGR
jgi:hypothetical protein